MSEVYQSLSHSKWDCKYHVVFVPKRRRKAIFGPIRRQLGPILHSLAKQPSDLLVRTANQGRLDRAHGQSGSPTHRLRAILR
jgi:hypothetical protein